jgi:hypothetical protein
MVYGYPETAFRGSGTVFEGGDARPSVSIIGSEVRARF